MDMHILERVTAAMDKVVQAFMADNDIVFADDRERTILKYALKGEWQAEWKSRKTCIHEGCTRRSIVRSHTVQRSGQLEAISENGRTLAPHFQPDTEEMIMLPIANGSASTFPGFCEAHERLFEEFEKAKDMSAPQHFRLQVYRTVCREIVKKQFLLSTLEQRREQYVDHRNTRLRGMIEAELGEAFLRDNALDVRSIELDVPDHRLEELEKAIGLLRTDVDGFLSRFRTAILDDIDRSDDIATHSVVFPADVVIPVALAGSGNFAVPTADGVKNVDVILNVLPFTDKTILVISGLAADKEGIDLYTGTLRNPFEFLGAVESWMVHGSDHWFIRPSVWEALDKDIQRKILKDLHDLSRKIGQPYEVSILTDLRKEYLQFLNTHKDEWTEGHAALYEREAAKLRNEGRPIGRTSG